MSQRSPASRFIIEGYVIVSADGMLAKGDHQMPNELKFAADKAFFATALDRADLVVHGRLSQEEQRNTPRRKRIIVTHRVTTLGPDPDNPNAIMWNPAGSDFEAACEFAGVDSGRVAIIGGPAVFDLFMARFDTFWLSQAAHVWLPGGEPCFGGVPERSPQQMLAAHGLEPGETQVLDAANDVTVTAWRRPSPAASA
jgi:dihydrofolate reductase